MIAGLKVGEKAKVEVFRNGKRKTFNDKLAKRSNEKLVGRTAPQKQEEEELGIRVTELTPEISQRFNLGDTTGVVVVNVEPGSKGAEAGVQMGDIIKEINHKVIKTVNDYKAAIGEVKKGETIQMFIRRMNIGFLVIKLTK